MTISGIQIYLIIGFVFAEGKWRFCESDLFIFEALRWRGLSGQILLRAQRSSGH